MSTVRNGMDQAPDSGEDLMPGARRPDRGHRLPGLSWRRLLRPGVSGNAMIALFLATLLTFLAAVLLVGHH